MRVFKEYMDQVEVVLLDRVKFMLTIKISYLKLLPLYIILILINLITRVWSLNNIFYIPSSSENFNLTINSSFTGFQTSRKTVHRYLLLDTFAIATEFLCVVSWYFKCKILNAKGWIICTFVSTMTRLMLGKFKDRKALLCE